MFEVYAQTRYRREEQIGTGEGMNSIVYRAFDPYLEREIAVKEIEKSRFGNDFAAYCAEARAMFGLADPHIVPINYVCETADHVGLALPYFPKGSLKGRIADGPLDFKRFLKLSNDVFSGVSRIHSQRFLHLDLKPSNVLFDETDRALIADFGQARRISARGDVKFPEMYRWATPPEVWDTHIATVETDIYQVGVLLYRAANGDPVYLAQKDQISTNSELQKKIARGKFPDPNLFLPHVPARVRTIIRKAMRVDPANRYHSVSEMAADLRRVPLTLNWRIQHLGNGSYKWLAERKNGSQIEVELRQSSPAKWESNVWTLGEQRRAKGLSEYWEKNMRYSEACRHLTEVFADLGA